MFPQPLNPTLYRLLQLHFGRVEIAGAGLPRSYSQTIDDCLRFTGGDPVAAARWRAQHYVRERGEQYRVNCPYCHDTKLRLYVGYLWCVWDEDCLWRNETLIYCQNEQCLSDHNRREQLIDSIFSPGGRERPAPMHVQPGVVRRRDPNRPAPSPGKVVPIGKLAREHPAVVYLRDRGFDPQYLDRHYRVSYCVQAAPKMLTHGRLIIPTYNAKGTLVWWQARSIGDPAPGTPKYWSCPRVSKSQFAYNFDLAVQHQTIVIVEGPTDVWRTGPWSMALLGKSFPTPVLTKLHQRLQQAGDAAERTVAVMLDPKQDPVARVQGRPHHIQTCCERLGRPEGVHVLPVYLPEHLDPGSAECEFLLERIRDEARKAGVPVSFRRPAIKT